MAPPSDSFRTSFGRLHLALWLQGVPACEARRGCKMASMFLSRRVLIPAALALGIGSLSCSSGARSLDPDGGAGAIGTGIGGSSGARTRAARNPLCPSTVPTQGGSCKPILTCGYPGSAPHGVCSIIAGCGEAEMSTQFTWFVSQRSGCGVNAATCPAAFSALAPGSPCPGVSSLLCSYQEGACGCVPCASDGGVPNSSMWACRAWGPDQDGCPPDPPLWGDACAPNQICSYGVPCVFAVGPTMICVDGYWEGGLGGDCLIRTCGPS
jgi:hypothetical protein